MKVLITGERGFIGSNLLASFRSDEEVDVVGNIAPGADFAEYETMKELIGKAEPDLIFHCAGSANVGLSVVSPLLDFKNNVAVTQNLLFALNDLGATGTRVVFLSSAGVYGNPASLPIKECDEVSPLSPYALHKSMSERACLFARVNYGIDVRVARIFSAYGPGLRKQLFWDMYKKASTTGKLLMWGTGNESRDYIYITDLVRALKMIAFNDDAKGGIFNVANGEEVKIKKAVSLFAEAMGLCEGAIEFNGIEREGDPLNWRADISRLRALGYSPSVSIEEGISEYAKWAISAESEMR